uniref:Eukaryotic translation initiation factor 3 subunit M n=1 Tax=Rhabditophanes sp. KR3021 TaxID=114890 RepID=A0AC35UAF5_9BILA
MDNKHIIVFSSVPEAEQLKDIAAFISSKGAPLKLKEGSPKASQLNEIIQKFPQIIIKMEVDEVEKFLNSILTILVTSMTEEVPDVSFFSKFITALQHSDFDGKGSDSKAGVVAKILNHIFLSYTDMPEVQKEAFFAALNMYVKSGTIAKLNIDIKVLESYFSAYPTSIEERRDILRAFYKALINNGRVGEGTRVCFELFKTFTSSEIHMTVEDAKECARANIKDNNVIIFDTMLKLPAFENLKKVAPLWHEVLTIFMNGNYITYAAFATKNPQFIKELGIDNAVLENRMRNLTLVTFAEKKSLTPVNEVLKQLGFKTQEDFELYQVKSWMNNNVTTRINDITKQVYIEKKNHRQFNQADYNSLSKNIDVAIAFCKNTIENLESLASSDQLGEVSHLN